MNYFITTLAIGEPYFSKSLEMYINLHEKTVDGYFNITTSKQDLVSFSSIVGETLEDFLIKYPRLKITTVEDINKRFVFPLHMEGGGFTFNLNLKVLALKVVVERFLNSNHDCVIFIDGDWSIIPGFEEKKILDLIEYLNNCDTDFLFERPAPIEGGRVCPEQSFFREKLEDYKVTHTKWDTAHVVNEQFLVFKNNEKLNYFVQRWEQFLWYSIANNIRNYPDGFEIGISALEADLKWEYWGVFSRFINDCFSFYTKTGDYHVRY